LEIFNEIKNEIIKKGTAFSSKTRHKKGNIGINGVCGLNSVVGYRLKIGFKIFI
jgi:hypothetical protein